MGGLLLIAVGCASDPPTAVVGVAVDGCGPSRTSGSGVVVGADLVLTSAHTLRGAETVEVVARGRSVAASIVGFDPELDLAYLRADLGRSVSPIPVAGSPVDFDADAVDGAVGQRVSAWAVRGDAPVALRVDLLRRIRLQTEDIYVDGDTVRPAYELRADLLPGDSGGPVIVDGAVVAVLWARSTRRGDVAYTIDSARGSTRIDAQLASGDLGDVDLERCD